MFLKRSLSAVYVLISLPCMACSPSTPRNAAPLPKKQQVNPDLTWSQGYPAQLQPLARVLQELGIQNSYTVSALQTPSHTKNPMFEFWLIQKSASVTPAIKKDMYEWKQLNSKGSRDEEVGTLVNTQDGIYDVAEQFTFAKDLLSEDKIKIATAITQLKDHGIEFGYDGYDPDGCPNEGYLISPLFLEPLTGVVYSLHYAGPCR